MYSIIDPFVCLSFLNKENVLSLFDDAVYLGSMASACDNLLLSCRSVNVFFLTLRRSPKARGKQQEKKKKKKLSSSSIQPTPNVAIIIQTSQPCTSVYMSHVFHHSTSGIITWIITIEGIL